MKGERISLRLLLVFALLALLPLAGGGWFFALAFERALSKEALGNLVVLADKKADQIGAYMHERSNDGQVLAYRRSTMLALENLSASLAREGLRGARYQEQATRYRTDLQQLMEAGGYYDMLLIDVQGKVVFSVRQEADLGADLQNGPYRDSALATAWRGAINLLDTQVALADSYEPSYNQPAFFSVTPMVQQGRVIGAVALQLDLARMAEVTVTADGLGRTGEVVLAELKEQDDEVLFVSPLWQMPQAAFRYRLPLDRLGPALRGAVRGESGSGRVMTEEGREVLSAWHYLPELRWGMVVQVDIDEALAPAMRLRWAGVLTVGLLLVLVSATAFGLGRGLALPIRRLAQVAERLAQGDWSARPDLEQGALEVRQLAEAFESMRGKLQMAQVSLEEQVSQRTAELSRALQLQQAAQTALVMSADQLEEAQRMAHIGSWELDLASNKLHWSNEIFRLFEIDQTKFGATYEAFLNAIHPDDREAVNQAYGQSLVDRLPYEITHRLQMPDGRIKWVQERCTSTFDDQGKPLRSVGTVQDITLQYQAEQALEQLNHELEQRVAQRTAELVVARDEAEHASRAKSEFLSRMSHELRTPLNAVLGFGQLMAADEEHPLAAEQLENVQEILQAGRHLLALVNEMLDLGQIEIGHIEFQLEPVAVQPVLAECLGLVRPLAQQRQISLNVTQTACVLQADRMRLRQVLLNLLSNAIKYNRDGGRVDVRCQPAADGHIRIEVSDNGQGIAPENMARLFRPFERLESAYKGIEGAGVGLALTRRLVEGMGGEVGVHSVLGEGSTFWLTLPAAARALALADNDTCRVLYVEDNPINIRVMAQVFAQRPQLSLHTVGSAEDGLVWARAERPDLILMDINLPGMDGYQALAELKADATTADIPVLAVSANAMQGDRERGLQAGFVDYVAKPLDVPRFLDLLMHWCTHAQAKQGESK